MKREIKFRGRALRSMEWKYGSLIKNVNDIGFFKTFIVPYLPLRGIDTHDTWEAKMFPVDPSTVGQYTGLKDRNGREIYEWDIVRNLRHNTEEICYFHSKYACFCFQERIGYDEIHYYQKFDEKVLEVIGNIYEDPVKLLQIEQDLLA